MRKAVYAGSFDPPTNGHLWMIEQGSKLFDSLVVAIGLNPDKNYVFPASERGCMLKEITKAYPNTCADHFEKKYVVNYAKSIDAGYILRGIRTDEDYDYERKMRHENRRIDSNIETVFLMPPNELEDISSSFVMGLVGPEGWEMIIQGLVPEAVYKKILGKYKSLRAVK